MGMLLSGIKKTTLSNNNMGMLLSEIQNNYIDNMKMSGKSTFARGRSQDKIFPLNNVKIFAQLKITNISS